ncbi:MAG: V-type ATP synthase subunit I [Oscillospiraceae bacterium]|nr:V-type ATP synthase subunit I [Oscillospiraceae bacterium]MDD4368962.1 V-type ATP synthase subunit I [Oscillospiraceae bacterium]
MAIEVMEKVLLLAPRTEAERLLTVLQSFQKLELRLSVPAQAAGFDAASPQTAALADKLNRLRQTRAILRPWQPAGQALARWQDRRPCLTWSELDAQVKTRDWERLCTAAADLSEQLEGLRQRRQELSRRLEQWSPWRELPILPAVTAQAFQYTRFAAGTLPAGQLAEFRLAFNRATADSGVLQQLSGVGQQVRLLLFYPRGCQRRLLSLTTGFSWNQLIYPFEQLPRQLLPQWESAMGELVRQDQTISRQLCSLATQTDALDLAEAYYQSLLLRQEARPYLLQSATTCLVTGWIAQRDQSELRGLLDRSFGDLCAAYFTAVQSGETAEVPIRLRNHRLASAFENLTEMYGLPAYDEVDPTPVMTPFYMAFFGMMVADLGYGLVLLITTLLARWLLRPAPSLRKNLDFFYYLSFPIMAWGLVYGSFFGLSLPWALLSPTRDIIPILILSLILGWIQLMTGLGMNVYVHLKQRRRLEAWSGGGVWMLLLGGLALFLFSWQVLDSQVGRVLALLLALAGVLGIVILPVVQNQGHRLKGLLKGLYALYGTTSYVGDLVSYSRLMALGVAGSSIAIAFNTILATLPLIIRLTLGIVLAVLLHGLNLFLSLLSAYVHGIRLQYVEFFGKFYQGGGRRFKPFKSAEEHVALQPEAAAPSAPAVTAPPVKQAITPHTTTEGNL